MRVPVTLGAYLSPAQLLQSDAWASATIEGASLELMRVSQHFLALRGSCSGMISMVNRPPTWDLVASRRLPARWLCNDQLPAGFQFQQQWPGRHIGHAREGDGGRHASCAACTADLQPAVARGGCCAGQGGCCPIAANSRVGINVRKLQVQLAPCPACRC